jgi:PrtD family type I secretion system ABC transporter
VLLAVAVFGFVANALLLAIPLYTLQVFDRVLTSRSVETLAMLTLLALGALAVFGALDALRARTLVRVACWTRRACGPRILARAVEEAALRPGPAPGEALRDLARVRGFLCGPPVVHLLDLPWVPLHLGVVALIHPLLGAVAAAGALLVLLAAAAGELAARRTRGEAADAEVRLAAYADARLRDAEALRAMGMVPAAAAAWARDAAAQAELHRRGADRADLAASAARTLRLSVQVAVVGVGAWLAVRLALTPGAMIAASIVVARALVPVEQMAGAWRAAVEAARADRRLAPRLAVPPVTRGRASAAPPRGRLEVEDATLAAPGGAGPAVLRAVRFDAAPGERIGVIGPSGAGKSALARLLVGLREPSSGAVRLDGLDLRAADPAELGRHVGYLPQECPPPEGPVRRYVARLGEHPDDAAVEEAARLAGAHDAVLRLPRGYDTQLGPGGVPVPAGLARRLALARAFHGRPRLLVLDEPLAHLDGDAERAVLTGLRAARGWGATAIVLGHRAAASGLADRLVLLRDGRVRAFGPRDEVLALLAGERPAAAAAADASGPRPTAAGVVPLAAARRAAGEAAP